MSSVNDLVLGYVLLVPVTTGYRRNEWKVIRCNGTNVHTDKTIGKGKSVYGRVRVRILKPGLSS